MRSVSFNTDGKLVLTNSLDRTARVRDASTGEQVAVLKGHASAVNSVDLSQDGRRIVPAGEDHTVRLWRLHPPDEHATPLADPVVNLSVMSFSPDGQRLVTGGNGMLDSGVRVWDTTSGKLLHKLNVPRDKMLAALADRDVCGVVWDLTFSPGGRRLLTVGQEKKIRVRKTALLGLLPRPGRKISPSRRPESGTSRAAR